MRNKKKTILIDLDHTLIDTERIKNHHERILRRFGVSAAASGAAYKQVTRKHPYHPVAHTHAAAGVRLGKQVLRDYWKLFEKKEAYNFPGVTSFLKTLSKKYRIVLLSLGHKGFQSVKFNQAGFWKWFKRAVFTRSRNKKKDLAQFFKKYGADVLLLDDSQSVISTARAIGMKAIRVKKGRKNAAYYRTLLGKIKRSLN